MYLILCLLLLAVLHGTNCQECVPEPADNLDLLLNKTLIWKASTNCESTSYRVTIAAEDGHTYFYVTNYTWMDVSFLPECEEYSFQLQAVSNGVLSPRRIVPYQVPLEEGANVTITKFVASHQGVSDVHLEWSLEQKFLHCVRYFRVVLWDGESQPLDTYTSFYYIVLYDLTPCTVYEFTVTPIYNLYQVEGGIGVVRFETPPHTAHFPELVSVRPGTTYVDMTWSLPRYSTNRCLISTFIVDGSPYVNLTIPISDTPERLPVPIHVESLLPDKMYLFRVIMINSGGASTPIPIAIQTVDAN